MNLVRAAFLQDFSLGATGAWYAITLSNVTAAIAGAFFFFRGRWLQDVLADDSTAEAILDADTGKNN